MRKGWIAMSDAEYFDSPEVSFSDLKLALKGALAYRNQKNFPLESSTLSFGTAFHEKVLFGKEPLRLTPAPKKHLEMMVSQLKKVEFFQTLLHHPDAVIEVPGFFEGQKCKPDLRIPSLGLIVDLKTTTDASPQKFKWAAKTYDYHLQARHYLDVASAIDSFEYQHFLFVACEKTAPYNVFLHECSENILTQARELKKIALEKINLFKKELESEAFKEQNEIFEIDF